MVDFYSKQESLRIDVELEPIALEKILLRQWIHDVSQEGHKSFHCHFPVLAVDENAQRHFHTNGSEGDHSPGVSKGAFGVITEVRETCLKPN